MTVSIHFINFIYRSQFQNVAVLPVLLQFILEIGLNHQIKDKKENSLKNNKSDLLAFYLFILSGFFSETIYFGYENILHFVCM